MRQLTLFSSSGATECDVNVDDGSANASASGASHSPRATSESEYVSFADLATSTTGTSPPHGVVSRMTQLLYEQGDHVSDTSLVPLSATDMRRVRRMQDTLLVVIGVLCLLLVSWACTQLYQGRLCVTTKTTLPPSSEVTTATVVGLQCAVVGETRRFASRGGGPNITLQDHAFEGGWSLSHSLLHVFVPVALLLTAIAMRLQSPTVYTSLAWVGYSLTQLGVLVIDALALRTWRSSTCTQLQAAIVAATEEQDAGRCETREYEAFVAVEMVLVVVAVLLAVLEPVLVRLWWGVGHVSEDIETTTTTSDSLATLQHEDAPSPQTTYRRL